MSKDKLDLMEAMPSLFHVIEELQESAKWLRTCYSIMMDNGFSFDASVSMKQAEANEKALEWFAEESEGEQQ